MEEATLDDLDKSIQEISAYRDRLKKELIANARKLQMPNNQINSSLETNAELTKLEEIISHLKTSQEKI